MFLRYKRASEVEVSTIRQDEQGTILQRGGVIIILVNGLLDQAFVLDQLF